MRIGKALVFGICRFLGPWDLGLRIFALGSSSSAENFHKPAPRTSRLAIALHGLRIFDQPDRGRELRILECARQAGHALRMRDARRDAENVFRKIVDAVQQTASARNENPVAEVIQKRLVFEARA